MQNQTLKQQVLRALDLKQEIIDTLGPPGPNGNYRCYNNAVHSHGDVTHSLSVQMTTGLYKCFACGETGDIFDLILHRENMKRDQFGILLKRLAAKYGINANIVRTVPEHKVKRYEFQGFKTLPKDYWHKATVAINAMNETVLTKLVQSYGIDNATCEKYHLGWHPKERRLFIPIPVERFKNPLTNTKLINVRKHDILRKHCEWTDGEQVYTKLMPNTRPIYRKRGKVIGVTGHNVAYMYPMESILDNHEVWLVGGELKALLLNQLSIPAVCFTAGEGNFHKSLIVRFTNKVVRVVGDIDEAGKRMTEKMSQIIANNGAEKVYAGYLPADGLPYNGDITDFLLKNGMDPTCLKEISWEPVEKQITVEINEHVIKQEEPVPEFDIETSNFHELLNPMNAMQHVRIPFAVAGRAETPFLLPKQVNATCDAGSMDVRDACIMCPMKRHNFEMHVSLTQAERIELVGQKPHQVRQFAIDRLRLPRCEYPDISIDNDSIEKLVIIPTLDKRSKGDQFNYRQHAVYSLGEEYLSENMAYEGVGKVLPDPKNSAYTWAIAKQRALDNDIFSYKYDEGKRSNLINRLHHGDNIEERLLRLVRSLSEHKLQKYDVDRMILLQLLAFFMPFEFSLGNLRNYKVCPEVCILGETRCGKSSTAKDLLGLFGAGRYIDSPTVTTIGLVGGNQSFGKTSIFTWGALPMCHRAIAVIDEANKFDQKTFQMITNLRSSGIAERTTVGGIRKTKAHVRFLWLCNPRDGKRLQYYSNPIQAAVDVFGSPQDLARLDVLHIQYAHHNAKIVNRFAKSTTENFYNESTARYHLQWAWHLEDEDIVFDDSLYILDQAIDLVESLKTDLLPVAEAKFKIARMAAGFSALAYNQGRGDKCYVTNDAVDLAVKLLRDYSKLGAKIVKEETVIHPKLSALLGKIPYDKKLMLRVFVKDTMITSTDLARFFGDTWSTDFIQLCYYELDLIHRRKNFYIWDENLTNIIKEYLHEPEQKVYTHGY